MDLARAPHPVLGQIGTKTTWLQNAVQVICPTGSDANLICGLTLHSFLSVPVGTESLKDISPLLTTALQLKNNLNSFLCSIVDERLLIGENF